MSEQIVWLVETLDWPDSISFMGVYVSLDAALAPLRERHPKYEVRKIERPRSDIDEYEFVDPKSDHYGDHPGYAIWAEHVEGGPGE